MTRECLTLLEAQNLTLRKQRLAPSAQGESREDVIKVVRDLCGIQYDPLPVIAQAHYITLWNRIRGFKESWLDSLLYKERKLVEFMLMRQTLNIVDIEQLPYFFQGTRSVARSGWIQSVISKKEDKTSKEILERLSKRKEVSPKDFDYASFRPLFYSGKVFIAHRNMGVFRMPYYRLLSDYFPNIELESVDETTAQRYLVLKTLSAYGVSPLRHIAYWIGYKVKETEKILLELEKEGIVSKTRIEKLRGLHWISTEDSNRIEANARKEDFVALLTLMDNLVRDRAWLQQLFGYTFEVEYFHKKGMKWHVNILYNNEFLGFINPKMDRRRKTLIIKDVALKRELKDKEWQMVVTRIKDFAQFHDAMAIRILKTEDSKAKKALCAHGFSDKEKGELSFSF